jgi:hypothetical protein
MIDSPVSLATLEALETAYASPASIPADIPLAELETIRAGWLAQARAQQIPDKLFEIGRWLGKDMNTLQRGIHRCYFLTGFRICVSVVLEKAEPDIAHRMLTAFLDDNTPLMVMVWNWRYFVRDLDDELPGEVEETDLLYIPGAWTTTALAMTPKAEAARIGFARNAETAERDALAKKLLVGLEV